MGKFWCWTFLLLQLAAGFCAASDIRTLIATVADTANCELDICTRQVPVSSLLYVLRNIKFLLQIEIKISPNLH
jgi:hypothetical protein